MRASLWGKVWVALALTAPFVIASGGPSVLLQLSDASPSATYPDCAEWMDVTSIAFASSTITTANITVRDANAATWRILDLPTGSTRLINKTTVPFEGTNGTAFPSGDYEVTVAVGAAEGTSTDTRTLTLWHHDDDAVPLVGLSITSATRDGEGWHNGTARVIAYASDDCRIASLSSQLDGVTASNDLHIATEGRHWVNSTATDLVGNTATQSAFIGIDKTLPAITMSSPAPGTLTLDGHVVASGLPRTVTVGVVALEATATDALSGIDHVAWLVDGAQVATGETATKTLSPGLHDIVARAIDQAGNTRDTPSLQVLAV